MSLARQIVEFAIKAGSSDIHLEEGSPIAIRVNSDIRILENILEKEDMSNLLEIVGEEKLEQFQKRVIWTLQLVSKDSHEYESMLTSPTNVVVSPFESFQMTFHVGKILAYHNPSLISLRSIVD